jgi:PAS domain S-box-containing protein
MSAASKRNILLDFPRPLLVLDQALQVVGFSRRALPTLGLRLRPGSGDTYELLTDALAARPELADQLALATARLLRPGDEERFAWTDGARTFTVTASAMDGDEVELLVLLEDITASSMSEEILRNARTYLEQILDDLPLGIGVLSAELRVTSANRRLLGFLARMGVELSLVDTIGASFLEVLPNELGQRWQALCQQVIASGLRAEGSRQGYPVEDGQLVLATMALPLRGQQERPAGVMLIAEDVTEETRLERELVRAEKLATVGQMVITINHEINNPLSIISTNAQTLRLLNPDLDEKIVTKLSKIEIQVKRIAEVTERLRRMDEVATSEYIASGPEMIDVWGRDNQE